MGDVQFDSLKAQVSFEDSPEEGKSLHGRRQEWRVGTAGTQPKGAAPLAPDLQSKLSPVVTCF